ncbi:hypothetical protein SDC9_186817 [bioreactor metagenome]|uniref:Uncharacterized protein n=1 Tax=bioreactor metagenome TaxID=1076179 RepID=A0A645HM26_9ZZZZ
MYSNQQADSSQADWHNKFLKNVIISAGDNYHRYKAQQKKQQVTLKKKITIMQKLSGQYKTSTKDIYCTNRK